MLNIKSNCAVVANLSLARHVIVLVGLGVVPFKRPNLADASQYYLRIEITSCVISGCSCSLNMILSLLGCYAM